LLHPVLLLSPLSVRAKRITWLDKTGLRRRIPRLARERSSDRNRTFVTPLICMCQPDLSILASGLQRAPAR